MRRASIFPYQNARCRICGCTYLNACVLQEVKGTSRGTGQPCVRQVTCSWADSTYTLCNNPKCLAAAGHLVPTGGAA